MDLKVLCWNVEHFSGTKGGARKNRIKRVAELVEDYQVDVFAIMEVEGKEVFDQMVTTFPNYSFTITKGTQIQEILNCADNLLSKEIHT